MDNQNRGSMIPPDLRAGAERTRGSGGIGGRARENTSAAAARAVAMGELPPEAQEAEPAQEEIAPPEASATECQRCNGKVEKEWEFCSRCGTDLARKGAAKALGIEFGDDDVEAYIFKGFVTRTIKFLGTHSLTLRSSMSSDMKAIDNYLINGEWRKTKDGKELGVGQSYVYQLSILCTTAACLVQVDGTDIGKDLEARIKYLHDRGSAFCDMISERVILFNRAVTRFMEAKNTLSGS